MGSWLRVSTVFASSAALVAACSSTPQGSSSAGDPPASANALLVAEDATAPASQVLGVARTVTAGVQQDAPVGCPEPAYYGGRVIAQPQVVTVYWGPNIDSTVKGALGGPSSVTNFYSDILGSSYVD